MKKETLLTTAVVALLLLNFGILGFLFLRPGPAAPKARQHQFDQQIVNRLQLDAKQQQTFEQLKTVHHKQMRAKDQAYRDALGNYFALLKNDTPDSAQQDSLQAILSQIQKDRTTITFQHFQDLKALCTPEQKERFSALLPELMQVILPKPPKRK